MPLWMGAASHVRIVPHVLAARPRPPGVSVATEGQTDPAPEKKQFPSRQMAFNKKTDFTTISIRNNTI